MLEIIWDTSRLNRIYLVRMGRLEIGTAPVRYRNSENRGFQALLVVDFGENECNVVIRA